MEKISKVGVVVAGMMGTEIALCFAVPSHEVAMKDATLELAQKSLNLGAKCLGIFRFFVYLGPQTWG